MPVWVWAGLISGLLVVVAVAGAWAAWRAGSADDRQLVKRVTRLPLRAKLRLARAMFADRRIPLAVRVIPPALVLYLGMPIDIIPDFIPVAGQLDDVLVVIVGVGLLFRFTRREVLEEHVAAFEVRAE